MIVRIILAFVFISSSLVGANYFPDQPTTPVFGLMTVPKCGTHLLMKCLSLLQARRWRVPFSQGLNNFEFLDMQVSLARLDSTLHQQNFYVMHAQFSPLFRNFLNIHPEFPMILGIRDLHDAIVSLAHHFSSSIERIIGPKATLEQKINFLLKTVDKKTAANIPILKHHAEGLMTLFNHPNVLVVRFEDLVGSKGGGDDEVQRITIQKIANHIGATVSPTRIKEIQAILFGNTGLRSSTFRNGQQGAWRNVLTPEQIALFNKNYGDIQLALGYSLE
jgi:hypothetical protein